MKRNFRQIAMLLLISFTFTLIPQNYLKVKAETNDTPQTELTTEVKTQEKKILKELEDKREENAKYFLLDDFTYEMAVYSKPVHYLENGKWVDIDNSLSEGEDTDLKKIDEDKDKENNKKVDVELTKDNKNILSIKNNSFKINLAKKADSQKLVTLSKDHYKISWNIEGANKVSANTAKKDENQIQKDIENAVDSKIKSTKSTVDVESRKILIENEKKKTLTNVSSGVQYNNIFDNIDLQYNIISNTLKENIIINKKDDKNQLEYTFNISVQNLIAKQGDDKRIYFYDKDDTSKVIFLLDSPYMYDAKNSESSKIDLTLIENENVYTVKMTPDKDWLNSNDRVYPITIDPDIQTSQERSKIIDTFTRGADTENKYNNMFLRVGNNYPGEVCRSYIKFDLPSLTSAETVISATLALELYDAQGVTNQVNVHKITSSWQADANNNLSTATKPTFDSIIKDYLLVSGGGSDNWRTWNITGIVKDWYTNGNNYGILLKSDNENTTDSIFYASDLHDAYTNARPMIEMTYINNSGLESYWTYHTQDVGRAGTSYINDYNGNLIHIHNDIQMNGTRNPISISHIYNNNQMDFDSTKPRFGRGWNLNIYQWLAKKQIGPDLYYEYIDGDGTKIYFKDNGTTELTDELNIGYRLIKDPGGYFNYIRDKNDNEIKFNGDTNGSIYSFKDNQGNETIANWERAANGVSCITSIVDATGRRVSLTYDSNAYLKNIIDSNNNITEFIYDATYNKLLQIKYPDGKISKYDYYSNYNLWGITNVDNYSIWYEYLQNSPFKVKRVYEWNNNIYGNELNIQYGNNTTSFTDIKNRKEVYQFTDRGITVSIRNDNGSASYYDYKDPINKTKLSSNSKLQKSTINYLQDHDAELKNVWFPSSGIATYSSEEKYLGTGSLKVSSNTVQGQAYLEQYLSLIKGKTYTLSGYVKTINVSENSNSGASLSIAYKDSAGKWQYIREYINGTTDWKRYEKSFTVPLDISYDKIWIAVELLNSSGTAYFDSLQVEEGEIANRYNLIENSDFTLMENSTGKPLNWAYNSQITSQDYIDYASYDKYYGMDNLSMKFIGNSMYNKGIYQNVNISGKVGDVYVLAGWAKAASVPIYDSRLFQMDLGFVKADGVVIWKTVKFNQDTSDWQYIASEIVADVDYVKLQVYLSYYQNANTGYFDGIQLYKEQFATSYQYDSKGNVVSTSNLANQNSQFQYNSKNDLINNIDAKGSAFKYEYDGKHNVTKATTATNVVYSFEYDSYGNSKTAKISSVNGNLSIQSTATYDSSNNYLKTLTDSSGNVVSYSYNSTKGTLDNITDAKGNTTTYSYAGYDNKLMNVSKNIGNAKITNSYEYNNDSLTNINHNGFKYNFGYDIFGNVTNVNVVSQDGSNSQNLITNKYEDRNGVLQYSIYGNGEKITNNYDSMDRVVSKSNDTQTFVKYKYDGNSNLAVKEDLINNKNYRYSYDLSDRLSSVVEKDLSTLKNTGEIRYNYDLNNNISSVSESILGKNYTTSYDYDKDNRLTKTTASNGSIISQGYDEIGRQNNTTINTGTAQFNTSYLYEAGKTTGTTTTRISSVKNGNDEIKYTYDVNGNIETITENGKIIKYYYDELNELVREDNGVLNKSIVYSYDTGGNILSKIEYPYTTGSLGNLTSTINYGYGDTTWKDKLTNYNGKAITYDAIGNPLTYDGYNYTWEMGRQLKGINGNNKAISYKYNDSGIRTEQTVNGITTKYTLNGDKVIHEESFNNKNSYNTFKYDYSQNLQWSYHGFDIPVSTSKSYTYSFDAFISSDANLASGGTTFIASGEGGFTVKFQYDNNKKGTWQHFELTGAPTTSLARILMYPSNTTIPATSGYILYKNFQFKEVGTTSNLFTTPKDNNGFGIKANGVFECNYDSNTKSDADNVTFKYDYSQNLQWTYHGFDIPVSTTKSYTYSFDAFISSNANVASSGTTFIASGEGGFSAKFQYDNSKKGTWQHFELTGVPTTSLARILMYPSNTIIPATSGYILYRNFQFKEVGTTNNLFTTPKDNNGFGIKAYGVFECNIKSDADNVTFKYDYSQNLQWSYHGFDIPVSTTKRYTYSFDAFISPDANIASSGTTFIASGEYGFGVKFQYDNSKKGTWQHFEVTGVATDSFARILMYPSNTNIPATSGYILYKNFQFKEVGTTSNLFAKPKDNNGFGIKANGVFECIYDSNIKSDAANVTYEYDYSQNTTMSYHGYDISVYTGKTYSYSFDALISEDANIQTTGTTFIANGEYGFVTNFEYDNTKKGKWQHFEYVGVATGDIARILMYPSKTTIPATTGSIVYKNFQFRELGSSNNLFTEANSNSEFIVKDKGNFRCNNENYQIHYTYGGNGLVSLNLNGTEYYYVRNAQGDIIGLVDVNGTQVVKYTYDTWGKLISITGTLASSVGVKNPYRYRGYRYDTETGLYYLQSRYYNPDTCRMLNADSLGGKVGTLLSHNMFIYCFNNPVNLDDPSGNWPSLATIKKYAVAGLEVIAGGAMVYAGVMAFSASPIIGIALIAYGANHFWSGANDIVNIATSKEQNIGKNNYIRNKMKEGYGDTIGNTVYEACDLAVGISSFKVPDVQSLTKVPSMTIINTKFNIVKNNITSFSGINGLKNVFSGGWNINYGKAVIAGNSVRGYVDKFIKIFDGRE